MVDIAEKDRLVDEFSALVRRHFPQAVWRSLFEERTGSAKFGSAHRTLLCIECPTTGPFQRDGVLATLQRLVRRFEGIVDPCADAFAFVSFGDARTALLLAVELQRLVPRARLRMALAGAHCRIVLGKAAGHDFLMLLGSARAQVQALAERAAPGTVQLAPDAYGPLRETIGHLGSCLVLEAFDADQLTEVSLTLPPDPAADLSTFAGLGLT